MKILESSLVYYNNDIYNVNMSNILNLVKKKLERKRVKRAKREWKVVFFLRLSVKECQNDLP